MFRPNFWRHCSPSGLERPTVFVPNSSLALHSNSRFHARCTSRIINKNLSLYTLVGRHRCSWNRRDDGKVDPKIQKYIIIHVVAWLLLFYGITVLYVLRKMKKETVCVYNYTDKRVIWRRKIVNRLSDFTRINITYNFRRRDRDKPEISTTRMGDRRKRRTQLRNWMCARGPTIENREIR